jgi:hypothetical protein
LIGYDYLKFAFPYIVFSPDLKLNPEHSLVVVTTYDHFSLNQPSSIFSCIYDTYIDGGKGKKNIYFTTNRSHKDTIKTFDLLTSLRPYRAIIAYTHNLPDTILELMIKYNHRRVIIFHSGVGMERSFPATLNDHRKLDYDSDFEDDHVKNSGSQSVVVRSSKYYTNSTTESQLHIYTDGHMLDQLDQERQMIVFNDYHPSNLYNLLLLTYSEIPLDIVFMSTSPTELLQDVEKYPPIKIQHFVDITNQTKLEKKNLIDNYLLRCETIRVA